MKCVAFLVGALVTACAQMSPQINAEEAVAHVKKGISVIDVRSPNERQVGAFPGATHIIYGPERWNGIVEPHHAKEFISKVRSAFPDKATPIILFCNAGVRSLGATSALLNDGYANVSSVRDGFMGNEFGEGIGFHVP